MIGQVTITAGINVAAAIYLIGFVVIVHQWSALLGERGLLPTPAFIKAVPFRLSPSLFIVGAAAPGMVRTVKGLKVIVCMRVPIGCELRTRQ